MIFRFHQHQAAFKKIDAEHLDKLATGARWRFRLASGALFSRLFLTQGQAVEDLEDRFESIFEC